MSLTEESFEQCLMGSTNFRSLISQAWRVGSDEGIVDPDDWHIELPKDGGPPTLVVHPDLLGTAVRLIKRLNSHTPS